MRKVIYSEKLYFCPVTNREEILSIKTTTLSVESRMRENAGEEIARKETCTIIDCSGLKDCGVRIVHGNSLSHDWSQCPAIEILKTSRKISRS